MTARYQLLPPLTASELADLRADVETHGVQVPILVDESGEIIDGHHRKQVADALGVPCPTQTVTGYSDAEKRDMAYRLNLHRRHLTAEQKRECLARSIVADPGKSNRQHAERIGTAHQLAGVVRSELQTRGDVDDSSTRTDTIGRQQPVRESPVETAYTSAVEEFPDLAHYADKPERAVAIAAGLRAEPEAERPRRVENLQKSIAAQQRRAADPEQQKQPDHYAVADAMFRAANAASQAITKAGGLDAFIAALDYAEPIEIENWRGQFVDLAAQCQALADAARRPGLRSVN